MLNTNFENCSILIVGGAGFVGSNLCRKLLTAHNTINITVIDNLLSSEKENLPSDSRLKFIHASITNGSILNSLTDTYDYIFHLATFHGNQNSIANPLNDHENNTLTTLKLFDHIKTFKFLKKVIYSSAGCSVAKKTFGDAKATTEDDPIELKQDSPYSISKIIGEFYSVYFGNQFNLPIVRARFQNVYGPGEILGAGEWRGTYATVWRNVIPVFIYKSLKQLPLPVENNGIATRDFIFVDDLCDGLIDCTLNGIPGEVYNLGSGEETSIYDLAQNIISLTNSSAGIEYLPRRSWDNSGHRFASTDKALQFLGFKTRTPLVDGLRKTIEWTQKNLDFIDTCISKHKYHI